MSIPRPDKPDEIEPDMPEFWNDDEVEDSDDEDEEPQEN
jgi:hypothetical protein